MTQIKICRLVRNLRQIDIASQAGISLSRYREIDSGEERPTIDELSQIEKIFKVHECCHNLRDIQAVELSLMDDV